jgi:hypothetical protein
MVADYPGVRDGDGVRYSKAERLALTLAIARLARWLLVGQLPSPRFVPGGDRCSSVSRLSRVPGRHDP